MLLNNILKPRRFSVLLWIVFDLTWQLLLANVAIRQAVEYDLIKAPCEAMSRQVITFVVLYVCW